MDQIEQGIQSTVHMALRFKGSLEPDSSVRAQGIEHANKEKVPLSIHEQIFAPHQVNYKAPLEPQGLCCCSKPAQPLWPLSRLFNDNSAYGCLELPCVPFL